MNTLTNITFFAHVRPAARDTGSIATLGPFTARRQDDVFAAMSHLPRERREQLARYLQDSGIKADQEWTRQQQVDLVGRLYGGVKNGAVNGEFSVSTETLRRLTGGEIERINAIEAIKAVEMSR